MQFYASDHLDRYPICWQTLVDQKASSLGFQPKKGAVVLEVMVCVIGFEEYRLYNIKLHFGCRLPRLDTEKFRPSWRPGPKSTSTTFPSSTPNPTKSGTPSLTQVHGRVQPSATPETSACSHNPRLLHVLEPRAAQNNLPLREGLPHPLPQQDHPPPRNRSTPPPTQKWIDDSLSKKLLVRETVFYLGTAYDSTRIHDPRQDAILREIPKKEEPEFVYINPELLSDQKRLIEVMERPHLDRNSVQAQLKKHFQQVDRENIGVITQPEFLLLLKNVGIKLNPL